MKIKYMIALVGVLFIMISCKKEQVEPPGVSNTPVFTLEGSLNGESLSLQAGVDNFYMNTSTLMINGVEFYNGVLTDGNTSVQLGLYNGNLDLPEAQFNQSIPNTLSFIQISSQPLAFLSKDLLPNTMFIDEIRWFINGVFAGVNYVEITTPGKYEICAQVYFTDQTYQELCNEMILGYTKHASGQLRHFLSQSGNLQVWVEENAVAVSSVKWYVDNQLVSEESKLALAVDEESHLVSADISFVNGVKRRKSILIDGSLNGKFIDDFSVFENSSSAMNWDYGLVLEIKRNGKVYRSDLTQNQSSSVQVNSVTYYGLNPQGKKVYKIDAQIDCSLKETASGQVVPFSGKTSFGVEIDE